MTTSNWTILPDMQIGRGDLSCVVDTVSNEVYAIDRRSVSNKAYWLASIEKKHLGQDDTWQYIDNLTAGSLYTNSMPD